MHQLKPEPGKPVFTHWRPSRQIFCKQGSGAAAQDTPAATFGMHTQLDVQLPDASAAGLHHSLDAQSVPLAHGAGSNGMHAPGASLVGSEVTQVKFVWKTSLSQSAMYPPHS
ncbi:hypothetical protein DIPPA_21417 [Diplonema papillatum]|nr:hypothetical protein DIPPA_21417 [Diplonema papillatum]